MNLDFQINDKDVLVKLRGDIDEYASRILRDELDKLIDSGSFKSMTLDLSDVSFIDSTGIGFLLGRYKRLREKRAELLVKNVPPQVDKVFRTSGIYSLVPKVK